MYLVTACNFVNLRNHFSQNLFSLLDPHRESQNVYYYCLLFNPCVRFPKLARIWGKNLKKHWLINVTQIWGGYVFVHEAERCRDIVSWNIILASIVWSMVVIQYLSSPVRSKSNHGRKTHFLRSNEFNFSVVLFTSLTRHGIQLRRKSSTLVRRATY